MNQRYDVCIIGGGAAGLAAAASIDRRIRVCIVEKNEILGRKILATGGGRCNLTNAACEGADATLDFFALHGLASVCDSEGRYYPYSGCASDVVQVLETAARENGCHVLTGRTVDAVEAAAEGGRFLIRVRTKGAEGRGKFRTAEKAANAGRSRTADSGDVFETIEADTVILAAGGKAAPQFGTAGDSYRLARMLGHHVSRLYPILTAVTCGDLQDLKGIRARATVRLRKDGEVLAEESGEVQFLRDGLSGICVFNLTPLIRAEEGETPEEAFRRYRLELDLAPDFSQEQIEERIAAGQSSFGILNARLAERVGLDAIKGWSLPVLGIKGWKYAQCTGGGIPLSEVDPASCESLLTPGLYLTGETLDIQGPCGGYNLQNAWETGIRAAKAISRRYEER